MVTIQEASILLAACRYEEAVARAEAALWRLPSGEARLELLARNVITESLVFSSPPASPKARAGSVKQAACSV